jgi:hypothetical protein
VYGVATAIKAETDLLPSDPASQASTNAAITATQSAITTQTDLIKAKTMNLPNAPAAVGSKMDLVDVPNATAVTAFQSGLALAANLTIVLNRLGAWTGSGRNTILGALQSLFRSDAAAAVPSDINVDLGSGAGSYDNTEDSVQAIRASIGEGGEAPTAAENANAVWNASRSAHTTAGTFGEGVASVQGPVSGSVASVAGAVSSVTGNIGGNVAGSVGSVLGNIGGTVPDSTGTTTLLNRLTAGRAGYLDALAGWTGTILAALKALMRKDASASTDIGGTYASGTDSLQALAETVATLEPGSTVTEDVTINELDT